MGIVSFTKLLSAALLLMICIIELSKQETSLNCQSYAGYSIHKKAKPHLIWHSVASVWSLSENRETTCLNFYWFFPIYLFLLFYMLLYVPTNATFVPTRQFDSVTWSFYLMKILQADNKDNNSTLNCSELYSLYPHRYSFKTWAPKDKKVARLVTYSPVHTLITASRVMDNLAWSAKENRIE